MIPNIFIQSLAVSNNTAIAASQSPGTGVITLNGSLASGGVATLDTQRRVVLSSGGNDTAINFTVFGTNGAGFPIQDTVAGGNTTGTPAVTNLDFKTITNIIHSGTVTSTLTVGTGNTGSSLWQIVNWNAYPPNISVAVQLVTGAVTYTVEHTYDDPNILPGTGGLNAAGFTYPVPWPDATLNGASASGETQINNPITAWRLTTVAGTGTLSVRGMQDGISSP
jgi:hypothetical protein